MRTTDKEQTGSKKPLSYNRSEKTVMIVEDDRTHRAIMQKILIECDFNVVPAENGRIALSRLDTGQAFDLIIMDWDMPELNGLDTVREIRARQSRGEVPYIPVVAFTSNRQPGDREKCIAAGMDAYLPKDIWTPKWRETLVDNVLQGLLSGDLDFSALEKPARPPEEFAPQEEVENFDEGALHRTAALLKSDLPIAVEEYLEDAAAYIRDIKTGLEAQDPEKIARGSHPLKSNSRGFGLISVSLLAEAINTSAREVMKGGGNLDQIKTLYPQLQKAFYIAERRLRDVLKTNDY